MCEALSNTGFSHDQQLLDVVDSLDDETRKQFLAKFPEWERLQWEGSWLDTEAMNVEPDFSSWAVDWIEGNTDIIWQDGEPRKPCERDCINEIQCEERVIIPTIQDRELRCILGENHTCDHMAVANMFRGMPYGLGNQAIFWRTEAQEEGDK